MTDEHDSTQLKHALGSSADDQVARIPLLPEEKARQLDEILHHHRRLVFSEDEKYVGRRW
jgi:hypothetical protein